MDERGSEQEDRDQHAIHEEEPIICMACGVVICGASIVCSRYVTSRRVSVDRHSEDYGDGVGQRQGECRAFKVQYLVFLFVSHRQVNLSKIVGANNYSSNDQHEQNPGSEGGCEALGCI